MNERYFTAMINLSENGISGIHVPQSLPWYPQAFQTIMPRNAIRSLPVLKSFHNFLITEAELVSQFYFFKIYIQRNKFKNSGSTGVSFAFLIPW